MFCKGWVSLKEPWKNVGGYFTKSSCFERTSKKNANDFHILQSWVSLKEPRKNSWQFSNLLHFKFFIKNLKHFWVLKQSLGWFLKSEVASSKQGSF